MSLTANFWGKVNKRGPIHPTLKTRCWVWSAGKFPSGYGSFWVGGGDRGAHRVAWYMTYGKWPAQFCLHKCDNPSCVRPSHLFEGTPKDNMLDKIRKGRDTRGEKVCTARLCAAIVRSIRKEYAKGDCTQTQLAEKYNVKQSHISSIVTRKAWRHI